MSSQHNNLAQNEPNMCVLISEGDFKLRGQENKGEKGKKTICIVPFIMIFLTPTRERQDRNSLCTVNKYDLGFCEGQQQAGQGSC